MNSVNNGNIELLPCPFCGHPASCNHTGLKNVNSRSSLPGHLDIAEYYTHWSVKCNYCGVSRGKCVSYYFFSKDGKLKTIDGCDGRSEVINIWNTRAPHTD